jgi:hypothetical protein
MRASFEVFCARFAALRPVELKPCSPGAAARGPAAQGVVSFWVQLYLGKEPGNLRHLEMFFSERHWQ